MDFRNPARLLDEVQSRNRDHAVTYRSPAQRFSTWLLRGDSLLAASRLRQTELLLCLHPRLENRTVRIVKRRKLLPNVLQEFAACLVLAVLPRDRMSDRDLQCSLEAALPLIGTETVSGSSAKTSRIVIEARHCGHRACFLASESGTLRDFEHSGERSCHCVS